MDLRGYKLSHCCSERLFHCYFTSQLTLLVILYVSVYTYAGGLTLLPRHGHCSFMYFVAVMGPSIFKSSRETRSLSYSGIWTHDLGMLLSRSRPRTLVILLRQLGMTNNSIIPSMYYPVIFSLLARITVVQFRKSYYRCPITLLSL